jgi:hypothetical protein
MAHARARRKPVTKPKSSPPAAATAAILYAEDGYRIDGARLMGRQSAGHGFLTAFARHVEADRFWSYVQTGRDAETFAATVASLRPGVPVTAIGPARTASLAEPGCLYVPGPDIGEHAWIRHGFGARAWSLCGVTHTVASHRVMDAITSLVVAPVHAWDAVICTSQAVKEVVAGLLAAQADYLGRRLRARGCELPQLPVIPLGVDCDAFAFDAAARQAARRALGFAPDEIVVLFLGRLSFHAKAHPLFLFKALGRYC